MHRLLLILAPIIFLIAPITELIADCPHCYDIIKVRVEFTDGTHRQGFFERFGAYSSVTDSAGNELVSLEGNPCTRRPDVPLRLIDTVYNFEGITHAACSSGIHPLDSAAIDRIILLEKTPYSGALGINMYDKRMIDQLNMEYVNKYESDNMDLQRIIYLNYNPDIGDSTLIMLADFSKRGGTDLNQRYGILKNRLEQLSKIDYPNWITVMKRITSSNIDYFKNERSQLDQLIAAHGTIGEYFFWVSHSLKQQIRLHELILEYLNGGEIQPFFYGYQRLFVDGASVSPHGDFGLTSDLAKDKGRLISLIRDFYRFFNFDRLDFERYLRNAGVLVVKIPVD